MNSHQATRIAAFMGLAAVALGAFGAHGLQPTLRTNGTLATWEKAVLYHFIHTLVLLILAQQRAVPRAPWLFFLAGIIIFSGSLYVLALTNVKWLGLITPFGGVSFLAGWAGLVLKGRTTSGIEPSDKEPK